MAKFSLAPGHEVRGFMVRLYPTPKQVEVLRLLEDDLRRCWNWLCRQTEEVLEATKCQAVREGLVPDPGHRTRKALPCLPPVDFDGMSPDEAKAAKARRAELNAAWHEEIHRVMRDRIQWRPFVGEMAKFYGKNHAYQLFASSMFAHDERGNPCSHMYEALVRNYYTKAAGMRRKKPRKPHESMPLQVRSGRCLEIGGWVPTCSGAVTVRPHAFGTRRGAQFYDALVKINGLRILGRLPGRLPSGRVLEGVSVTRRADGWWASIKVETPRRELRPAIAGKIVGIDVGIKYAIAAFDDGTLVRNTRDASFIDAIARLQSGADRADEAAKRKLDNRIARLHQKQAKHLKHCIYNEVLAKCADAEVIRIEKLHSRIGQMGTRHMSVMRLVRSMLVERYGLVEDGGRVEEIDPRYTSQVCSECGHHDKETWGHDDGPVKACRQCGYRAHRDVNAARNIARGGVIAKVRDALAAHKIEGELVAAE